MNRTTAFLMVLLVATLSLSGCLRNGKGGEGEAGPEYDPGPYGVLTYEDLVYASGLAHTATSSEAEPVSLKLDVYCPDTNSTDRPVLMFIHGGGFKGALSTNPKSWRWEVFRLPWLGVCLHRLQDCRGIG